MWRCGDVIVTSPHHQIARLRRFYQGLLRSNVRNTPPLSDIRPSSIVSGWAPAVFGSGRLVSLRASRCSSNRGAGSGGGAWAICGAGGFSGGGATTGAGGAVLVDSRVVAADA